MIISISWCNRKCSVSECTKRVSESLEFLSSNFQNLGVWFEKGSPKVDASTPVQPTDIARISALLEQGVNRYDHTGEPIEELGYRMSLWNGERRTSATLSVHCGSESRAAGLRNSFTLEISDETRISIELYIEALKKLISIWRADNGKIFELSVLDSGEINERVIYEFR